MLGAVAHRPLLGWWSHETPLASPIAEPGATLAGVTAYGILAAMKVVRRLSRDPKIERLSQAQIFSGCNKRELARIAALSVEVEVPAGRVLIRQGDFGHEFFVIEAGSAKAIIDGRKRRTMGPGECFGEMALLHRAPRSATVEAETDMHLLVLNSREFSTLMEDVPSVGRKVLAAVAERLREAERAQPHH